MNSPQGTPTPSEDGAAAERARLRRVYGGYARDPRYKRLWADGPAHRFMLDRKWGMIAQGVKRAGLIPEATRVLDLGSGDRGDAARFGELGVPRSGIVAFDLIPAYARRMLETNPSICAVTGDAASLPFTDRSFGIVYQSTMFSSLLDIDVRRAVLGEIQLLSRATVYHEGSKITKITKKNLDKNGLRALRVSSNLRERTSMS